MTKLELDKVSRYMSFILGHKPEVIGISLDEHGWADVAELISGIAKTHTFSMEILEEVVRTDSKQRYLDTELQKKKDRGEKINIIGIVNNEE